jgi:hypothetical protein
MLIRGAFRFSDKSLFAGAPAKSGCKGLEKWGGFELADGGTLFLDEVGARGAALGHGYLLTSASILQQPHGETNIFAVASAAEGTVAVDKVTEARV